MGDGAVPGLVSELVPDLWKAFGPLSRSWVDSALATIPLCGERSLNALEAPQDNIGTVIMPWPAKYFARGGSYLLHRFSATASGHRRAEEERRQLQIRSHSACKSHSRHILQTNRRFRWHDTCLHRLGQVFCGFCRWSSRGGWKKTSSCD